MVTSRPQYVSALALLTTKSKRKTISFDHSFGLVSEYNHNSFGYGGLLSPKNDKDLDDFREFSVLCTKNAVDWIPVQVNEYVPPQAMIFN